MEKEKAILQAIPEDTIYSPEDTIYSFIDLAGLRRYLIDCPNMLVMFEVLINHIHEFKTLKREQKTHLYHSSPL